MTHDLAALLLLLAGISEYPGRYLARVDAHRPPPGALADRFRYVVHVALATAICVLGSRFGGLAWPLALQLGLLMAALLVFRYLLLFAGLPRLVAELGLLALFTVLGAAHVLDQHSAGVELGLLSSAVRQVAGGFVAAGAGTAFTRMALEALSLTSDAGAPRPDPPPEAADAARDDAAELRAGRVIGIFERVLVFGLAQAAAYSAIGFVLTAKSITRFKALDQRRFAEYYLVGTLSSLAWALGCSAATDLAAGFEPIELLSVSF